MAIKREVLQPHANDKRYIRRDARGRFTANQTGLGRSLQADRRQQAKTIVPPGQGDKGDQKRTVN
jgi:hypothetical protein